MSFRLIHQFDSVDTLSKYSSLAKYRASWSFGKRSRLDGLFRHTVFLAIDPRQSFCLSVPPNVLPQRARLYLRYQETSKDGCRLFLIASRGSGMSAFTLQSQFSTATGSCISSAAFQSAPRKCGFTFLQEAFSPPPIWFF